MPIDWFTVTAQAINFLVLVWLLRRFLYKPILKAIDAREKRIADELADAAAKQADAKKERDDYQQKNDEFDKQRAELLSQATDEANKEKQRLLGEAREAADTMSSDRMDALDKELKNLNQTITRRTQDEVFSVARKVLTDLADTFLEERATTVFIRQLRGMNGDAKSDLSKALKTSTDNAIVRSAFELPTEQQAEIQTAINETFSAEIDLKFETTPDLVSGIELTASGNKIAWSISDYLTSLEKGVGELLKVKPKAKPESKAKSQAEPLTS